MAKRSSRLHWHRPTRRRTPSAGVVSPAGFGWSGTFHFKAPDELVQAQRNGASRRAATTSATHHAPGEGSSTASVADGRQAICNSSAACSTTYFRARRREHARGAPVTRTNLCPSRNSTATDARAHGAPGGAIQRSGGVESRHAARSQPLRAERPLRVIGGMRSSRLRSATREPAQALDQCHPAAGVAPGPLHPSSPTGRDIGAVSCHGAGSLKHSQQPLQQLASKGLAHFSPKRIVE